MVDDNNNSPAGNQQDANSSAPGQSRQTRENDAAQAAEGDVVRQKEVGGRDGPDPTRYGDWEKAGRCIDF